MLQAIDLTIRYGERTAVSAVTLALRQSEVTAIIGPNGAGKSTFLRALNGNLSPSSGQILLNNESLDQFGRRTIARQITVVAQEAELRFPITVLEFVLGGRFVWASNTGWGWETERDLRVASEVLIETELNELSGRLMTELSGGERQRAVLARALATEAPILLLDEPTANLDLSHQSTLLSLVRQRCAKANVSALVVTHDINLAAQFADFVMLMRAGKAVAYGKPQEVLTPVLLGEVFDIDVLVDAHPVSGVPRITPVHEMYRQT